MGGEGGASPATATVHPMYSSARVVVDTVNSDRMRSFITPKVTSVVRAFVNMTTQLLSPPPTPCVVNVQPDVQPPDVNMQSSQSSHPSHPSQTMPTPTTSTSTSSDANPGSDPFEGIPCLPLEPRLTRHRDVTTYRPAALRPFDPPVRQTAITPPQSSGNSIESLQMTDPNTSPPRSGTVDSANNWGQRRGARHIYREVTGPPTREHWKPDSSSTCCTAPICGKPFTIFERRHHCRHCGNLFCAAHTAYLVLLDQDAFFHVDGAPSRACSYCYSDYKEWQLELVSRRNSTAQEETFDTSASSAVPINAPQAQARGQDVNRISEGGDSPSRGYVWSTF